MTEWGVFLVLGSVLGFMATAYKMFYQPMHELALQLTTLNANHEMSKESDAKRDLLLEMHDKLIRKNSDDIYKLDVQLGYIKDRTQK